MVKLLADVTATRFGRTMDLHEWATSSDSTLFAEVEQGKGEFCAGDILMRMPLNTKTMPMTAIANIAVLRQDNDGWITQHVLLRHKDPDSENAMLSRVVPFDRHDELRIQF